MRSPRSWDRVKKMDKLIEVIAGEKSYIVLVGEQVMPDLGRHLHGDEHERTVIVADANVWQAHGAAVQQACQERYKRELPVYEVPGEEASKSWIQVKQICSFLGQHRVDRQGRIIAFGGGVVTDLAGFAAAIWMRGIQYLSIPTTLLAQVDASVGGKTGINMVTDDGLITGKNMLGCFHHPEHVIADISLLKQLPPREFNAGLAESIKHGLLDRPVYDFMQEHLDELAQGPQAKPAVLSDLVAENIACKAGVVAEDEREHGQRRILNLGHTFAHALEAAFHDRYKHGEAVALGLIAACRLAAQRGKLEDQDLEGKLKTMIERCSLPTKWPEPNDDLYAAMELDKKAAGGKLRFIVPVEVGRVAVEELDDPQELRPLLEELAK